MVNGFFAVFLSVVAIKRSQTTLLEINYQTFL